MGDLKKILDFFAMKPDNTKMEQKMKTVYKVCASSDGFYKSYDKMYTEFELTYCINKTTIPKMPGSKLFVFDTLEHAKNFLHTYNRLGVVFECTTERTYPINNNCVYDSCIKLFWRLKHWKKSTKQLKHLTIPQGSLLVNSLTPIKIVYEKNSHDYL